MHCINTKFYRILKLLNPVKQSWINVFCITMPLMMIFLFSSFFISLSICLSVCISLSWNGNAFVFGWIYLMCIHYENYKLAYTLHIIGTKMDLKENKNHHTKKNDSKTNLWIKLHIVFNYIRRKQQRALPTKIRKIVRLLISYWFLIPNKYSMLTLLMHKRWARCTTFWRFNSDDWLF